jgi:hypothetical protein
MLSCASSVHGLCMHRKIKTTARQAGDDQLFGDPVFLVLEVCGYDFPIRSSAMSPAAMALCRFAWPIRPSRDRPTS